MALSATAAHTTTVTGADEAGKEINKDQWNGTAAHSVVLSGFGTAAEANTGDFDAAGAAAAAQAASQPLDADLTAIAALTSAADKVPYSTGAQAWALADFTAAARTVLDDTTVSDMRQTLLANRFPPGGRLYYSANTPISSTDLTAQSTVRYGPPVGAFGWDGGSDEIELWDGTRWVRVAFSEVTCAVPSTVCNLFDVFGFLNAGALNIETLDWTRSTGPIASSSNATPISIGDVGHGLVTGDRVMIVGVTTNTNANNPHMVTRTDDDNFTLDGSVGNGVGAGTPNWYKLNQTRATALAVADGRLIKSGDQTRVYLGTGMTWITSGQSEDSQQRRLLWNMYGGGEQKLAVSVANGLTVNNTAPAAAYLTGASCHVVAVTGLQQTSFLAATFAANVGTAVAGDTSRFMVGINGSVAQAFASEYFIYDLLLGAKTMRVVGSGSAQSAAGCNFALSTQFGNNVTASGTVIYSTQAINGQWRC